MTRSEALRKVAEIRNDLAQAGQAETQAEIVRELALMNLCDVVKSILAEYEI